MFLERVLFITLYIIYSLLFKTKSESIYIFYILECFFRMFFFCLIFFIQVTEQELIDFVAKNMMDQYKLRAGVIFLDRFPYTESAKISRKDLKIMMKKLKNID